MLVIIDLLLAIYSFSNFLDLGICDGVSGFSQSYGRDWANKALW